MGGKYGRKLAAECRELGDKAQIEIRETRFGSHMSKALPIVFSRTGKKRKVAETLCEWMVDNHICSSGDLMVWGFKFQIPEGKPISDNGISVEIKIKPNGKGEGNGRE